MQTRHDPKKTLPPLLNSAIALANNPAVTSFLMLAAMVCFAMVAAANHKPFPSEAGAVPSEIAHTPL